MNENIYAENGYSDRDEYLKRLACDYDLKTSQVRMIADTLGEDEDFDMLLVHLEEFAESNSTDSTGALL